MKDLNDLKKSLSVKKIKFSIGTAELEKNIDDFLDNYSQNKVLEKQVSDIILRKISNYDYRYIYEFLEKYSPFLLEETRDALVKLIIDSKNTHYMRDCARNVFNLSSKNVDNLIENIIEFSKVENLNFDLFHITENYFSYREPKNLSGKSVYAMMQSLTENMKRKNSRLDVERFSIYIRNLNSSDTDYIIKKFKNDSKKRPDLEFISYFACYANHLGDENINDLVDIFIENDKPEYVILFAKSQVVELSEKSIYNTIKNIIDSKEKRFLDKDDTEWDMFIKFLYNNLNKLNKNKIDYLAKRAIANKNMDCIVALSVFADSEKISEEIIGSFSDIIVDFKFESIGEAYFLLSMLIEKASVSKVDSLMNEVMNIEKYDLNIDESEEEGLFEILYNNINKLDLESIIVLIYRLIQLNAIEYIGEILELIEDDQLLLNTVKDAIFNSKDKLLIAKYLFISEDEKLITQIFGNVKTFVEYVKVYQEQLKISNKELDSFEKIHMDKFVDANIQSYIDNISSSKENTKVNRLT